MNFDYLLPPRVLDNHDFNLHIVPCPIMRNLKFILSYDGTDFSGWQLQPQRRTVQATLETAIRAVTQDERVRANASGRTDAGVHARGQVVNFYTESALPAAALVRAVNAHLPADVRILAAEEVSQVFDANKDAIRKLYRYVLHDGPVPDLFLRRYAYHTKHRLDAAAMHTACQTLKGRHDFHSFETDWPNRLTSIRTITHIAVNRVGDLLWLDVEADGFLYNMVRAIAGTLINIGRGHWPIEYVARILDAEDRREAGPTAPAHGLFLLRVTYP
jgi:tRNA pseudouridine38-40 synthase